MQSDTINKKSTWETFIKANKGLLATYDRIRNYKSQKIFSKNFNKLNITEKEFIVNLVPIFIENYFNFSFLNIPPPPPLPEMKNVENK